MTTFEAGATAMIGRVRMIWRYPVKSMAAEPLESADLSWNGLRGDRRWAFVRPDHEANGFPWHTIRENAEMCRYEPRLRQPERPEASLVDVRCPDGTTVAVTDPALADKLGSRLRLTRLHRGTFDSMPLSIITSTTVSELATRAQVTDDARRFRPNLLIEPTASHPFAEDDWIGSTVHIGETAVRLDRRDPRCVIVNVDPETGATNRDMLKVVASQRNNRAGAYGSTVRPGRVSVGDEVHIESPSRR